MMATGARLVLACTTLALGVGFVTLAVCRWRDWTAFRSHAVQANGHVIAHEARRELATTTPGGEMSRVSSFPIVQFRTPDGTTREFRSRLSSSAVADEVSVLYLPNDPEDARVDHWFALWGWIAVLGGVGACLALAGLVLLRAGGPSR